MPHISKGISSNKTAIVFLRPHYSILYYKFLTYFYMVMVWKSQERDSHKWCLNFICRVGGSGFVAAHPIFCTFVSRNPSFGEKRIGFLYSFAHSLLRGFNRPWIVFLNIIPPPFLNLFTFNSWLLLLMS